MIALPEIRQAADRVEGAVRRTPCARSENFSRLCGAEVYFKFENLQRTGSFKERGALNTILTLTEDERRRGLITASAGNHAQAVAYHAGRLGIAATVVMPDRTPLIKVSNTKSFGARVILQGDSFDAAYARAREIEQERGLVFLHAFEDERVIAGQGTIGLELLEDVPDLDVVVVPIGGGGVIAGIATACKELRPQIRVIGVEAKVLPSMKQSLEAGHPVTLPPAFTIADGIAVKRPGELTLSYAQRFVDEVVTVDDEEIANAILLLLEREKTVTEGAAATTLAALLNDRISGVQSQRVAMVLCGGNIDVNLLSRIIDRGLVKDGRMVRVIVKIEDRPGALARLLELVGEKGANVLEVHHKRTFSDAALGEVVVELTLETRGPDHVEELYQEVVAQGFRIDEKRGSTPPSRGV